MTRALSKLRGVGIFKKQRTIKFILKIILILVFTCPLFGAIHKVCIYVTRALSKLQGVGIP
jgi:hypothetical protein